MKICVQCPKCSQQLMLPADAADRRVTCENCWTLFKVPALNELSEAMKKIQASKSSIFVDEQGNTYG